MRRLIALTMLVAGCGIADFDVTQTVPSQMIQGSQTIQGSVVGGILPGLFEMPLDVTIQSDIQAHDTGPIQEVTLSSMQLVITAPAGQTWSFVTSIDVYVASTKSGSTLPKVKVATVVNPGNVTTMSFTPVPGVNLIPYINEGSQMTADASGSQPSQDVTFDGEAVFHVHPL
jgi:hypothetical protein